LPLTQGTRRAVRAWLYAYDDRRGEASPWVPPADAVGADAEEEAWVEEGKRLRSIIEAELGKGYEVSRDLEGPIQHSQRADLSRVRRADTAPRNRSVSAGPGCPQTPGVSLVASAPSGRPT
jgi:hypothetical protein